MKKKLLIAGGVVIVLLAGLALWITSGLAGGAAVAIEGISVSNLPDGSYTGVYEFKRWSNTLAVQVENNRIVHIAVEKDMLVPIPGNAGEVFRRVIEKQDTKVDAVAGATVSSKAYLKAIENALVPGAATGTATTQPAAPFGLEAYKALLEENDYQADKIEESFRPLQNFDGVLPDEAVLAFAHYLACACEGLYNYEAENYPFLKAYGHSYFSDPDYPALLEAFEGKLSPGAVRWLALKAQEKTCEFDIYEPDDSEFEMKLLYPFEHMLGLAKAWYALETEYPAIAASGYSGYYGNNADSWVDWYLNTGEYYGLSEEGHALYRTRQKASIEEFLGGKASKEYPFFDEIQAYYDEQFK